MDKKWQEMNSDERRAERFKKWLSPPGVTFNSRKAETSYKQKVQRLIDTIELKTLPDRVPVIVPLGISPAYNAGVDLRTVMYDYRALTRAFKKTIRDFDLDILDIFYFGWPAKVYELLDYKVYNWPGHGLPLDASSYQFIEDEYVKADEYDALLHDAVDYGQRVFLPRLFGAMEPFRENPRLTPYNGLPMGLLASFIRPDIRELYKKLIRAGEELSKLNKITSSCRVFALKSGFPILRSGFATAPFDRLGDSLRGTKGIAVDMYRRPEKILEFMDMVTPEIIASAVAAVNRSECPIVSIPLHKGQDNYMSQSQFEKFYWPPLKKVIEGLAAEGIVALVGAEGKFGSRLDYVKEVPKGTTIWWFEETDMEEAQKALHGTACIAGNVPGSLLAFGTPQEVKDYCRRTIEGAGRDGGLILHGTQSMQPIDPANFQAMLDAAREYGHYTR